VPEAAADLAGLTLHSRGKVREMYDLGDRLLMVASDRISAYDVVLPTPIPDKGKVLTGLSVFWFEHTAGIVANHLISTDVPAEARGRGLLVEKLEIFPVECVARGYLSGSGWKEYRSAGTVCGIDLPPGLRESDRLPEPIFTPATKAEVGHDENIDFDRACAIAGRDVMERLRELTLQIYAAGCRHAEQRGLILADTKLEFGFALDERGAATDELLLIDEVLTPDSSRFWPKEDYQPGREQDSFDKQYVRNYLLELVAAGQWDKNPPGPSLPAKIVKSTAARYREALQRLWGSG
jgi:phosphoribosylaminoimidazole-succinocarboxamide synthase